MIRFYRISAAFDRTKASSFGETPISHGETKQAWYTVESIVFRWRDQIFTLHRFGQKCGHFRSVRRLEPVSSLFFSFFYFNSDLVTFISCFFFSFTSAVVDKSLYRLHVGIWQFYLMTAAHWLCSTRLNNNKKPSQISIQLISSSSNIDVGIDVNSRNFQFHWVLP